MADCGEWNPNFVPYKVGNIVEFEGMRYQCRMGHDSQSDWSPKVAHTLWEGVGYVHGKQGGGDACPPTYQPSYDGQQQQQQQPYQDKPCDDKPGFQSAQQAPNTPASAPPSAPPSLPSNTSYTTDNGVEVNKHEADKKWYDLDEDKKKQLLAGGLALGLAAAAGGVYHEHEKQKREGEEAKQEAWALQNWIVASRERTDVFLKSCPQPGPPGPRTPTWVYSEYVENNPDLLSKALEGGEEEGRPLYVCRAMHIGGLQPGKCRPQEQHAYIGFGHGAFRVKAYELLLADPHAVRWVPQRGRLRISSLGAPHVDGGYEDDKTPLVVARAHAKEKVGGLFGFGASEGKGGLYPGKASEKLDGAYVVVGEKEVKVEEYEVLCYARD